MSGQQFPEMVDALGEKPNGERVLVGKVPIPERMKIKDIIADYYGRNFDDEDSEAGTVLALFDEFLNWQTKQRAALVAQKEGDTSGS